MATDLYYGEYTGDYLPEALVGRLSVADSEELAVVVHKIVAFEQGDMKPSCDRCLLVAGREDQSPAPTTTNGQVNYLEHRASLRQPVLLPSTHHNEDTSTTEALMALLHRPYAFVNYTGHGLRSGWSAPVLTAAMVDTLTGFSPAVMVNNCCLTNAFDGLCFGEQMLRNPHGAVGVIGATNETLWNEDYYWAVGAKYPPDVFPSDTGIPGAFDTLLSSPSVPYDADASTLGRMLYNGCRAVTLSGSAFDAFYWETYCLLGDPSMVLPLGEQDSLWIEIDTPFVAGDTRLKATTPPYARVSVTTDSTLLGTAVADSTGNICVPLAVALTSDSVDVTVVRLQGRPYLRTVAPAIASGPRVAVTHYRADDSLLHVRLVNVGRQPATDVRVILVIGGDGDSLLIPRLAAGEQVEAAFPLRDTWFGRTVEGLLTACADTVCTDLPVTFEASECARLESVVLLTADSLPAAFLLPDREYILSVTLTHPVDSIVAIVNGQHSLLGSALRCLLPLTLDASYRAEVVITLYSPCGSTEEYFWLQGFRAVETFEGCTVDSYPWQVSQTYPWQIDTFAYQGRYALRSAPIPDGMKSTIAIDVQVLHADSVTFHYNVSSEATDWLNFYVDGRKVGYWSGATGWRRYAWPLSAGRHLLEWHYVKDGSVSERDDCARIDNVAFPLCRWDAPYGTPFVDSTLLSASSPVPRHSTPNAQLSIYPNLASDGVTVEYPGIAKVSVVNALGQTVGHFTVDGKIRYSTGHLSAGVYWFLLRDCNATPRKIIVIK